MQVFSECEVTETRWWETQAYSQSSTVHSEAAELELSKLSQLKLTMQRARWDFEFIMLLIHISDILLMDLTCITMKTRLQSINVLCSSDTCNSCLFFYSLVLQEAFVFGIGLH